MTMAEDEMPSFEEVFAEMTRLQAILGDIQRSRWMTRWNSHQKELAEVKADRDRLVKERDDAVLHLRMLIMGEADDRTIGGRRPSIQYVNEFTKILQQREELKAELARIKAKASECQCACCVDQECHCGGICTHPGSSLQVRRK